MTNPQTRNQSPYQPRVATSTDRDSQTSPKDPKPSKSSKKPYIFGMVFCTLLAIAGIAFGVYGILKIQSKDAEISNLNAQIGDQNEKISSLEAAALVEDETPDPSEIAATLKTSKNPVISAVSPEVYLVHKDIPFYDRADATNYRVALFVRNGAFESCQLFQENTYQNDCSLSGLTGKISKISTAAEGQNISDPTIVFLMEDGTVAHIAASQFKNSPSPTIEGTYAIDGFVTDFIDVVVGNEEEVGSYGTTLFVLSDGTLLPFGKISKK